MFLLFPFYKATINIIFDRVGKVDPVTKGIEIAVKYFGFELDVSTPCLENFSKDSKYLFNI